MRHEDWQEHYTVSEQEMLEKEWEEEKRLYVVSVDDREREVFINRLKDRKSILETTMGQDYGKFFEQPLDDRDAVAWSEDV